MSNTSWHQALEKITPYVFKVVTPQGHGTGFQVHSSDTGKLYAIATAYHVVAHVHEWEEPLRLLHYESGKSVLFKNSEIVILPFPDRDLAIIMFPKKDLPLPPSSPILIAEGRHMKQGADIGWCGFPSVQPDTLSFFAGHVSSRLGFDYLVDGVAINGVSGGPAFYKETPEDTETRICGVISEYRPNLAVGVPLPGLSLVRAVDPYLPLVANLRSLEQAKEQAKEVVEQKESPDELRVVPENPPAQPQIVPEVELPKKQRRKKRKN